MRTDFGADQADGLRRLLVNNQARVITFLAGKSGVGRSTAIINLAAALARSGKDVLLIDENEGYNNVLGSLGLCVRYGLPDVIGGRCKLGEAILSAGDFSVLPAFGKCEAQALSAGRLNPGEQQRLEHSLTELKDNVDVILLDAAMPALMEPVALAAGRVEGRAESLPAVESGGVCDRGMRRDVHSALSKLTRGTSYLVVADATARGIIESYALIKRFAQQDARLQFEIVVNNVTDGQAARTVFDNMARLALRDLDARLDYVGFIPQDDRLKHAAQQGKSVLEAFPSAVSVRSYMGLANRLLFMPSRGDIAEAGVRGPIRDLMRKAAQPQQRCSREIEHVVN